MTPQEREVIDGIFNRLKPAAAQARDPEAETYIAGLLRQQPYAPYVLAQSVYVQEQALNNLQQENEQLKAQLAEMQRAAQAQPQAQSGGFLSGLFGGGAPAPRPAAAPPPPPQRGPWGGQPQAMGMQPQAQPGPWGGAPQAAAPAAGGGFLSSALTTVAGVAGGMVVGNMLMNAFKGSGPGSTPAQPASSDFQPFGPGGGQQHLADQGQTHHTASAEDEGYNDDGYDDSDNDTYEA